MGDAFDRNLTPHQLRLLRGERYERLKAKAGRGGRPPKTPPEKLGEISVAPKYATPGHQGSGLADRLARKPGRRTPPGTVAPRVSRESGDTEGPRTAEALGRQLGTSRESCAPRGVV